MSKENKANVIDHKLKSARSHLTGAKHDAGLVNIEHVDVSRAIDRLIDAVEYLIEAVDEIRKEQEAA